MKKSLLRSKPAQAVAVVGLVAAIALSGTFAWYSFNQNKINSFNELVTPDTNLHDDFAGGPNKDVYVENSGSSSIYVRVRLTEFLQTDERGSLVEGHLRGEGENPDVAKWWAPHNGLDPTDATGKATAPSLCTLTGTDHTSEAWAAENFHDYYTWIMGGAEGGTQDGQIYYKPATEDQKGQYDPATQAALREPVVVSDPLTETAKDGDAHLDYKTQVEALMGTGKTEDEAMAALGLQKTLTAKVISMTDWLNGNPDKGITKLQTGDFWVIDEADGWCYWAAPLKGGEATGLLLDKVDRTDKRFDSNAEYCINAWLQAVDKNDLGRFNMEGSGGISENAVNLLNLATGTVVADTTGALYRNNDDGTYTLIRQADGTEVQDAAAFVPVGVDADGKPLGVNSAENQRIPVGQKVTMTELVWDGTDYTNYNVAAANNGWYNLAATSVTNSDKDNGNQIYELTGAQKGGDGKWYLKLSPIAADDAGNYAPSMGSNIYVGSVLKSDDGAYSQGDPGTGPYAILYTGADGVPGTRDDSRLNPSVTLEDRHFYHVGNGVYVEVAEEGSTTPLQNPATQAADGTAAGEGGVTYYFAGKAVTTTTITGLSGTTDEKVAALFPTQLTTGEKFDVTFGTDAQSTTVTGYAKAENGAYTFAEPVKGIDGNLYIYLGAGMEESAAAKAGYLAVGGDNYLGNTGDTRRWAGKFGIGGTDDSTTPPNYFSESFLNGKTADDLAVGKSITVDRVEWWVLDIDEYGNRLLTTKNYVDATAADNYASSTIAANLKSYYDSKMPSLKPYVMDAFTPVETGSYAADRIEQEAMSHALPTQSNPTAFALSQSEWLTYTPNNHYKWYSASTARLWSRSPAGTGYSVAIQFGSSYPDTPIKTANGTSMGTNPSVWVRFSDADELALSKGTTQAQLDAWKNMPAIGSTVTIGSYAQSQTAAYPAQPLEWKVLAVDGTKALVVTDKIIDHCARAAGVGNVSYSSWYPTMTNYLNSNATFAGKGFMEQANFSAEEKAMVVNSTIKTETVFGGTSYTSETAKVFLLSQTEVVRYMPAASQRMAYTTVYAQNGFSGGSTSTPNSWYIRTPPSNSLAAGVGGDGSFGGSYGFLNRGFRPAMWVDFSK